MTFQTPFNRIQHSLVKTFVMMIGEFEFDTIFHSQDYLNAEVDPEGTDSYFLSKVFYSGSTYTVFIVFAIIMSILIMNLLVSEKSIVLLSEVSDLCPRPVLEEMWGGEWWGVHWGYCNCLWGGILSIETGSSWEQCVGFNVCCSMKWGFFWIEIRCWGCSLQVSNFGEIGRFVTLGIQGGGTAEKESMLITVWCILMTDLG